MAPHYEVFYSLKTTIRRLVREQLQAADDEWWENRVPEQIRKDAEKLHERDADAGFIRRSEDPMDFLTFGQLSGIISANWDVFGAVFSSAKAVERVMAALNTLRSGGRSRIAAHSPRTRWCDFASLWPTGSGWATDVRASGRRCAPALDRPKSRPIIGPIQSADERCRVRILGAQSDAVGPRSAMVAYARHNTIHTFGGAGPIAGGASERLRGSSECGLTMHRARLSPCANTRR